MADDVPGKMRIHYEGTDTPGLWQGVEAHSNSLASAQMLSTAPCRTCPFTLPWHAGQIGHEFPKVFLSYSVMIAASGEGQDGSTSFITAPCREGEG